MSNNVGNVTVAKPKISGGILVAPLGTTLPTDETTALDAAFAAVGYATDDGVTRGESRDTDTKFAWGGDTIAVLQKSITITFKFTLAEYLNPLTQKLIYGDANVAETAATSTSGTKMAVSVTSTPPPHKAWVFEMISGVATDRIVIPNGQISDTDDVAYKDDDIASRGVTVTLFPDSTGHYLYEYTNDGIVLAV